MTTTLNHLTRLTETTVRLKSDDPFGFFTFEELEELEIVVKELRKGVKRHKDGCPFMVFVDGGIVKPRSLPALRRFLSDCRVDRSRFEMFRNIDKGITVHFDMFL